MNYVGDKTRSDDGGASAALRGFRLQILYTLARLTEPTTTLQATLWPEGVEDLAIVGTDGKWREVVQVKGYRAPLTLSELTSDSGRGLLWRALDIAREHSRCKIMVLSFGPIGRELVAAWNDIGSTARKKVCHKLRQQGFAESDVDVLFGRVKIESADEAEEVAKVDQFLSGIPLVSGASTEAAALLSHWLYGVAERAEHVTHADLVQRITSIGQFLHLRARHWKEWYSVIAPLDDVRVAGTSRDLLRDEFLQGMSARYEHIVEGCDIPRSRWLAAVSSGFSKGNVVVIHGASGQGKSTLAYRWLHEEAPPASRFEVKAIDCRRHALEIASTLAEHARAIGVPITVYVDVRPGNKVWTELVQDLARSPSIRVLVSIREEDWRATGLTRSVVAHADIELTLDEVEARGLFHSLASGGRTSDFLRFEEAWQRFVRSASGHEPLLEFVYLVTRTDTLRDRLRMQLDVMREAIALGERPAGHLQLVAIVSFASALGARVKVSALRAALMGADVGHYVTRLEHEFLLRVVDNGVLLDGLHPLRSELLSGLVCDGMTFDARTLAQDCLGLIFEADIETFLLHLATRLPDQMDAIIGHVTSWYPNGWIARGCVLRTLLWWGTKQYARSLHPLLCDVREEYAKAWMVVLDVDIAGVSQQGPVWKSFDFFSDEQKARCGELLAKQPDKAKAMSIARHWAAGIPVCDGAPQTEAEWENVAEVGYWIGKWGVNDSLRGQLAALSLDPAVSTLPLRALASVLVGLWELEEFRRANVLDGARGVLTARFSAETNTPILEDDGETVRAHFVVDWPTIVEERVEEDESEKRRNRLHELAIGRVELLAGLYPGHIAAGCKGYGHAVLPLPYDETIKTLSRRDALPPWWGVRVNGALTGLVEYEARPAGWNEYLSEIWNRREQLVTVMGTLQRCLSSHFRDRRKITVVGKRIDVDAWAKLQHLCRSDVMLPKIAVDEWGFTSEGKESVVGGAAGLEKGFAIARYRRYNEARRELFSSVENFLNQAFPYLFLDCSEGASGVSRAQERLSAAIKESGRVIADRHIVTSNLCDAHSRLGRFQEEFRRLFDKRFSQEQLRQQEQLEARVLHNVTGLWISYMVGPTAHWVEPERSIAATLWSKVDDVPRVLGGALRGMKSVGVTGRYLETVTSWDNEGAVWLVVETDDPVKALAPAGVVKPVLRRAIKALNYGWEQLRLIERRWPHILIITLFKGRSLQRYGLVLPIYRLTLDESTTEYEWLDDIPRPISSSDWSQTGLSSWNDEALARALRFARAITDYEVLLRHLAGCFELARTEGANVKVLQTYFDEHLREWSDVVQVVVDGCEWILREEERVRDAPLARPYLVEAACLIDVNRGVWLPPALFTGESAMSIDTCEHWTDSVLSDVEGIRSTGVMVLLDALSQIDRVD